MKTFLAKAKKPFINPKVSSGKDRPGADSHSTIRQTHPGLKPKYTVPPVPHPCPYEHIALLASGKGILLRPHGVKHPAKHVLLRWGKEVIIDEVDGPGDSEGASWSDATIVYGIVGLLNLYSGPHLLVISSRMDAGNFLDARHAVYGVKGVVAIPMVDEQEARVVIHTLASRNLALSRPSLVASTTADTSVSIVSVESATPTSSDTLSSQGGPRVQFSEAVKPTTESQTLSDDLRGDRPTSPTPSTASAASSENSADPSSVAKTLADRLSFWSRLSKRAPNLKSPNGDVVSADIEPDMPDTPLSPTFEPKVLDGIIKDAKGEPGEVLGSIIASTAPPPTSSEERHSELETKIIKECIKEYTKGGMYFAYNFDITRSLRHKQSLVTKSQKQQALLVDLNAIPTPDSIDPTHVALAEPNPTLPLWRRVDKEFWWNEWLSKPFIDAGLHSYVLPIMQGYYQATNFVVPLESTDPEAEDVASVQYIIVSRRSRYRAGLRYQRRGIDDAAHVANFVETETVMSVEREGTTNVFSYVQIRGSIPLYWLQTGYGLKPPPVIATDRTHEQQMDALKRHFLRTIPQHGPHTIVNLAEQQGREGEITRSYKEHVAELGSKDVRYYEYDFHRETRGMRYEKLSSLIDAMERTFDQQGFFWMSGKTVLSDQAGVFRVNCIDCLDRTNVVQSAFARYVLQKQLGAVALLNRSPTDNKSDINLIFNDVWANNGDAISRAYAGTSALKGDFTRTGKRDLSGMLNDGVNSLARMYTSTFSDWFSQAVIDFMLGNRTLSVFSEFLLKLQSSDPRDLIRLSKIRAEAIATSASRVLCEGESLVSGWTLFGPDKFNVKMSDKFEEKVLLLTKRALYIITYDYTLEKVKMYTRVPLGDIVSITKGAYIISPLEEASRDPLQNAGLIISWLNTPHQETRVTSYSIRNSVDLSSPPGSPLPFASANRSSLNRPRSSMILSLTRRGSQLSRILTDASLTASCEKTFAAFKVLPIDHARIRQGSTLGSAYSEVADELTGASNCKEATNWIVETICQACEDIGSNPHGRRMVKEEDIVSLAEAQRMTSMYAKMEYGLKRLLWLGS
ncbi:hypothetical protein PC9H_000974 [Pleurotus ostreatus]|uniref:Uncharacterized protein n=1 Tax=Pleurotus ostreatus TaxID=5322 RepID=A0A8H7A2X1_PLEOS|nr:uncharacterized protein PC9H_000974 [Pleurotus ostreatus]KAF7440628.1 hypothetical protein PC9H_000974 [Pleurotus ostreatus]KAJ8699994.1 hypothetical protein PTI98_003063 [Pleurotus ostreatus]